VHAAVVGGSNIGAGFVVPTVAACVDVVVHLALEDDGRRRVREVVRVTGRVEGDVIETETMFADSPHVGGERTPWGP
jgi:pilus assembly protein CpaF